MDFGRFDSRWKTGPVGVQYCNEAHSEHTWQYATAQHFARVSKTNCSRTSSINDACNEAASLWYANDACANVYARTGSGSSSTGTICNGHKRALRLDHSAAK